MRGCPSTFVLRRLDQLDALSEAERIDYADQLSTLAEEQKGLQTLAERDALLARLPLAAQIESTTQGRPGLRYQTVKSLARLAAEPGGIEGFIAAQGLSPEAARPPAPHITSFEDAAPVPPARLRKKVVAALEAGVGAKVQQMESELAQLVAAVPGGRMVLNLSFPGKAGSRMSQQMDYQLWADLDGARMLPTSYEAIWLLPARWDLITEANVDAAAKHLVRLVEVRLLVERGVS